MDRAVHERAWSALIGGKPLDEICARTDGGRFDLRGMKIPEASVGKEYAVGASTVRELGGLVEVRGRRWKDLDFTGAQLDSLRFFDCSLENCVFNDSRCQDWRLWGTRVSKCSFVSADLRRSALGSVEQRKTNVFEEIDFTRADLRKTSYVSGEFRECSFVEAALSKVDFQGMVFTRCKFEGQLVEVIFSRRAFKGEMFPPNEMKDVSFVGAELHHVEFRGLDLDQVEWPSGDGVIVVPDFVNRLDRLLTVLKSRDDIASRKLVVILGMKRKWAGPNQKRGVLSKFDLEEAGGASAVEEVVKLLRPS